jgi:predicted membrane protein
MEDSVKKIFRDKLRKTLLPDFTNKLTWLFGSAGVALIAAPILISLSGKASIEIFGATLNLEMLSKDRTFEGIALCVFALIQNISYQAYKLFYENQKNNKDVEHVKKEKEILEQKNEYLEAISPVNAVSQIKALKELHEMEVSSLKSEVDSLRIGEDNDSEIIDLEKRVQEKEEELSSIRETMKIMSEESGVTVGNEFVFGSSPFEYKGEKYLAGVINNIHMHFPLKHMFPILGETSSNPNDQLSNHWEEGKYVLTLNNEGTFKISITQSELDSLRTNISNIDTDSA